MSIDVKVKKIEMNDSKSIAQIALYAAVIAVLGLLPKFNIPIAGGIPITAQSMGIMLAGVMLGPARGALAACLFLLVVALGAPLLAGGRGGLGVFAGPTVGFLIGWPIAAFVAGWFMKLMKNKAVFPSAFVSSFIGGIVVLYACGLPGMVLLTNLDLPSAVKALIIFIPGDLIKVVLTSLIAQTVYRGLPDALFSRI